MNSLKRTATPITLLAAAMGLLGTVAHAGIDPAARALAKEVAAKLSGARTIQLTAEHRLDPALGVGAGHEKGPIAITLQRPNRFYSIQPAGNETREIAYDGRTLTIMHPKLKHHATESLRAGSVEQFADRVDERFGFRPPVAELLAGDLTSELFRHVASATVAGVEWVGWTACERLHFEQPGMTGDLWVGKKDRLPRRYRLTFTALAGHPVWDIRLKKWVLNGRVDETLFTKRPAPDSQKAPLLKSR